MAETVEVVYALPEKQWAIELAWRDGLTAGEVLDIAVSSLPIDDWREFKVGVFGEPCEPQRILNSGDRVEIYRELMLDAKQARRQRAEQQQQQQRR
jgi:putative ubiquitin-RnfH superfamily antitoxin RatB of RatAB toxin-antitoxin module